MIRRARTRRELLGALGVATTAALAGCSSGSDDGDDAIDPENDDVSDVLDAAASAYEELATYQTEETQDILVEMETFTGTRTVSEQQLMEEANGVFFDTTEETEVAVDLEADAYEVVGNESGEIVAQPRDEDVQEYYVDGTVYEFDDGPGGGEWTVDEEAEFDPPGNVGDFADQAGDVTGEFTVESRNDGDSVALTASFSGLPDAFEEDDSSLGEDNPFNQITTYDVEVVFAADTARPETTSLSVEGDVDEASMRQLLVEEPDSASGSFSITESTEFVAFDESVEIELPEGVSA